MPFETPSQYIESADEFAAHWASVNAALGATPLILRGSYALATFATDRTALQTAITAVQITDNTLQNAAGDRDIKKNAIKERIRQFRATVQGQLGGASYIAALPKLPSTNAAPGKWIDALDDMAGLWLNINTTPPTGFTGPLKLVGGYLIAAFTADVAAMKTAFTAVTNAERDAALKRRQRDDLAGPMRIRLKEYRQAVQGAFPAGHALIDSLPALSPPPGSTPDPVNLSAVWNPATSKANLVWSASPNPDLLKYKICSHPGPRYKAADEFTVDSNVNKTATTFATDSGLLAPGSVQYFKVYVVTTTGNEKGSNAVKVTRT